MSEELPQIDLNKLRDNVKAGEDTGHVPPDLANLTPQQLHDTHFMNPEAHPEMASGPSLDEIRKVMESQPSPEDVGHSQQ
jgi:hypothetical protein